jgi:hypothetical protein
MNTNNRIRCALLALVMGAGTLGACTMPAEASRRRGKVRATSKERNARIGTYLGSAATVYALTKGEGAWALIGAGATLLSYSQWKREIRRRHDREGSWRDYQRYRSNWYRTRGRRR